MPEYETIAIGLSGASCSGKTTLAREVGRISPQKVITLSFDEYWLDLIPKLKPGELPDWESPESYDLARFIKDMQALKKGESAAAQPGLLLVEGFLIYHSPVSRVFLDRKIFIDLPEEEIIKRRLVRPSGTFGVNDEQDYMARMFLPGLRRWVYPQRQYADLILDGLKPVDELAQEVIKSL